MAYLVLLFAFMLILVSSPADSAIIQESPACMWQLPGGIFREIPTSGMCSHIAHVIYKGRLACQEFSSPQQIYYYEGNKVSGFSFNVKCTEYSKYSEEGIYYWSGWI